MSRPGRATGRVPAKLESRAGTQSPTTVYAAPLKVTLKLPPEAWQGIRMQGWSCRDTFVPPPGSAFLGFLQCTKHISLLDVLVTALGA